MPRPRVAVLMDEKTSTGGTRCEAHKGYFHRLIEAGAVHQELLGPTHPGQAIFGDFVRAAGGA